MNIKKIASWIFQIVAALILLQTLYFKFSAHPESVAIFSKLGIEPWGRIGSGVVELIASLLLIWPAGRILGALLAAGTMMGAIAAHVFVIGIASAGDGGQLFALALIVLVCALLVLVLNKEQALAFKSKLLSYVRK